MCYDWNVLVSEISARSTCLRVFMQKPAQNSKQPEMNARWKMQDCFTHWQNSPHSMGNVQIFLTNIGDWYFKLVAVGSRCSGRCGCYCWCCFWRWFVVILAVIVIPLAVIVILAVVGVIILISFRIYPVIIAFLVGDSHIPFIWNAYWLGGGRSKIPCLPF